MFSGIKLLEKDKLEKNMFVMNAKIFKNLMQVKDFLI